MTRVQPLGTALENRDSRTESQLNSRVEKSES